MSPKKGERIFSKDYGPILIGIAKEDWLSALSLAETMKGRPENALFLAQQAVEKALKGVLIWVGSPAPLLHDLAALVAKLPQDLTPPHGYDLARLNDYAGILRYERGHDKLTQTDMLDAATIAKEVVDWAETVLASK
jgi:HEPN domain-containing protein